MPGGAPLNNHNHLKHGMRHTRIYDIWRSMRQRCQNPNCSCFDKYGARGITVCEEWNDFQTFYEWSKESGYRDDLTIDRIDVYGNYCPENCRWATFKEQANNKRTTSYLKIGDAIKSFAEWSEQTGVKRTTISLRIRHGTPPELILSERIDNSRMVKRPIVCIETGEKYDSVNDAIIAHNGNGWIRQVMDTPYTACGYHWKSLPNDNRKTIWNIEIIEGKRVYVATN